jgi:hypothetical protein
LPLTQKGQFPQVTQLGFPLEAPLLPLPVSMASVPL